MTMQTDDNPPAKRRRVESSPNDAPAKGLTKPISPPLSRRKSPGPAAPTLPKPSWSFDDVPKQTATPLQPTNQINRGLSAQDEAGDGPETQYMASPVQLTKIKGLAPAQNVDTVSLKDVLGDPLIRECWNFNFLFDLDFVMQQFDQDVRDLVKVKIVHGFWMRDDERRIQLMEIAERYPNLDLIPSYLPDRFGTHHSKMMILFRHDDYAQVIIHTANMISKDWTNMTQAIWRSPLLPLSDTSSSPASNNSQQEPEYHPIGSGERFKVDILQYLNKYEHRLRDLTKQLKMYDFSAIRAAFIGSAPSRQKLSTANSARCTSFGWLGLQQILSSIPSPKPTTPHIVIQVSSIATLGPTTAWLSHFQSTLARTKNRHVPSPPPKFNIIFPTAAEIRSSLDGYESGGSIHTRLQSVQQQKQLAYSRPLFCHWRHPTSPSSSQPSTTTRREAHRGPAAPHIKTYIRFSSPRDESIDWAMVTSANLSKQAWGEVPNKDSEVRIQSYEVGVVVWPALFAETDCGEVSMVPVFGRDMPVYGDVLGGEAEKEEMVEEVEEVRMEEDDDETEDEEPRAVIDDSETEDEEPVSSLPSRPQPQPANPPDISNASTATAIPPHNQPKIQTQTKNENNTKKKKRIIALRMPYDLPLSPYAPDDEPWCASMPCAVPDWMGRAWTG